MHRCAEPAVRARDQLPFEYGLADVDDRLGRIAGMLGERQHELGGNRDVPDGRGGRFLLVRRKPQAAVQLAEVVGRSAHERACMLMQSTGQGAIQSSQPVHSAAITVCIS